MEVQIVEGAKKFVWPEGWTFWPNDNALRDNWITRKGDGDCQHGVMVVLELHDGQVAERTVQNMVELREVILSIGKFLLDAEPGAKYKFVPSTPNCPGCTGRASLMGFQITLGKMMKGIL
jgi:hypothetical protein